MHARFLAHIMLAALSAATLLAAASAASHGATGTMIWTELAYPTVEADMHKVLTTSRVTIDSKTDVDVGYIKFYRSGDVIGEDAPCHNLRLPSRTPHSHKEWSMLCRSAGPHDPDDGAQAARRPARLSTRMATMFTSMHRTARARAR